MYKTMSSETVKFNKKNIKEIIGFLIAFNLLKAGYIKNSNNYPLNMWNIIQEKLIYRHVNDLILLQLYHSFVTPYLIYYLEIWGNASDIHLQPLITTIVRIITFSSYCSHKNI